MFKLTKTRETNLEVLINIDKIDCLLQLEDGDTMVLLSSQKKIYLKGDIESNMAILGLKSGE
ncbi:MAG: hypothetical protein JJE55_08165 [Flavobacteriaceae bacterium]|nr:hypothetical protein [Flavobacteriaceae bacterium]